MQIKQNHIISQPASFKLFLAVIQKTPQAIHVRIVYGVLLQKLLTATLYTAQFY